MTIKFLFFTLFYFFKNLKIFINISIFCITLVNNDCPINFKYLNINIIFLAL